MAAQVSELLERCRTDHASPHFSLWQPSCHKSNRSCLILLSRRLVYSHGLLSVCGASPRLPLRSGRDIPYGLVNLFTP